MSYEQRKIKMKIYRYKFEVVSNKVVGCDEKELDCFKDLNSPWSYIDNSNKIICIGDSVYFLSFTKISNYRLKKIISAIEIV